jgi:hypothetical protein
MLVEFASVVDAVRCAVEVQRGMSERNVRVSADKRIEFRIGINLGDIIIVDDDNYGDGVNIAARLEGIENAVWDNSGSMLRWSQLTASASAVSTNLAKPRSISQWWANISRGERRNASLIWASVSAARSIKHLARPFCQCALAKLRSNASARLALGYALSRAVRVHLHGPRASGQGYGSARETICPNQRRLGCREMRGSVVGKVGTSNYRIDTCQAEGEALARRAFRGAASAKQS